MGEEEGREGDSRGKEREEEEKEEKNNRQINGVVNSQETAVVHSQGKTADYETNQNSQKLTPGKGANFFEGVEKLLEVWFTRSGGSTETSDLRNIPRYRLASCFSFHLFYQILIY